jgi:hypothetical protein
VDIGGGYWQAAAAATNAREGAIVQGAIDATMRFKAIFSAQGQHKGIRQRATRDKALSSMACLQHLW